MLKYALKTDGLNFTSDLLTPEADLVLSNTATTGDLLRSLSSTIREDKREDVMDNIIRAIEQVGVAETQKQTFLSFICDTIVVFMSSPPKLYPSPLNPIYIALSMLFSPLTACTYTVCRILCSEQLLRIAILPITCSATFQLSHTVGPEQASLQHSLHCTSLSRLSTLFFLYPHCISPKARPVHHPAHPSLSSGV